MSDKLNLNTATEADLRGLGLNKKMVANILALRENRGGFKRVSELLDVEGFGAGKFDKVSDLLYVEDWRLKQTAKEKAEQLEWMAKQPEATHWIQNFLNKTFPNSWCNLTFEHVDAAAYWYTFELVNDDRRQTWCVRHSDLSE